MFLLSIVKKIFNGFMTIFLALMVSILFLQLFFRGVFGYSFTWVHELASILFICMVFVGSYVLSYDEEHISVDIFESYLSPKNILILKLFQNIMIFIVIAVVVYGSYHRMIDKLHEPTLSMPFIKVGYLYMSIFLAFLFQGILMIFRIISVFKSFFR